MKAIDLSKLPEFDESNVDLRDLIDALRDAAKDTPTRHTLESIQSFLNSDGTPFRFVTKQKFTEMTGLSLSAVKHRIERNWTKDVEFGYIDGTQMIDTHAVYNRWAEELRELYDPPTAESRSAIRLRRGSGDSGSQFPVSGPRKLT